MAWRQQLAALAFSHLRLRLCRQHDLSGPLRPGCGPRPALRRCIGHGHVGRLGWNGDWRLCRWSTLRHVPLVYPAFALGSAAGLLNLLAISALMLWSKMQAASNPDLPSICLAAACLPSASPAMLQISDLSVKAGR